MCYEVLSEFGPVPYSMLILGLTEIRIKQLTSQSITTKLSCMLGGYTVPDPFIDFYSMVRYPRSRAS